MTIRGILEELVSQGWFGKTPQGEFFDQKEDVDKALNHTLSLIHTEIEKCVPEKINIGKDYVGIFPNMSRKEIEIINQIIADFKKRLEDL